MGTLQLPFNMAQVAPRIDVPCLMRGLKSTDEVTAQNAGAMLGYHACSHEEHREAIAAQTENVIEPLTRHFASGNNGLIHNAALLLGQCLRTSTEFRQAFAQDQAGPRALVASLQDPDAGVVANLTFAIRQLAGDECCHLSGEFLRLAAAALPTLLEHEDARIRQNAEGLSHLLRQRDIDSQKATSLRRDKSMTAVQALANIAAPSSFDPLSALASLASSFDAKPVFAVHHDDEMEEECSPTGSHPTVLGTSSPAKSPKRASPSNRRQSLLAPWKKNVNVDITRIKDRKFVAAVAPAQAAAG